MNFGFLAASSGEGKNEVLRQGGRGSSLPGSRAPAINAKWKERAAIPRRKKDPNGREAWYYAFPEIRYAGMNVDETVFGECT
ncbi:MAG: hypothetical protein J5556_06215 [Deltaproteobacteria bacterium]|nr:hypothetical protein [Deltaproteobacteria bacterium]